MKDFQKYLRWICGVALLLAACGWAVATPTENLGIKVLPAPGKVVVDGSYSDWDLSGSIFASGNVESQRDDYSVWLSAMYDRQNLYILARFNDKTPMNNPGQTLADYGWNGDALQIRTITAPGSPNALTANFTAWRGRGKDDVIDVAYADAKRPNILNAKIQGAQQAFALSPGGQGYVQEIAIPWKLLTLDGLPLQAGSEFQMTFEPNFTVGTNGRWSIKDSFKPNVSIDRVFTFMTPGIWGDATLEAKGNLAPRPVRIAGGRTFPVHLVAGVPVTDWTGVIQTATLPGFKPITFTTLRDGFVSLIIKASDGRTIRQLLNSAFYAAGKHTVLWDGLTTPNADQPGSPVPAGDYHWSAIYNTGIGLKLRGWADNGGSVPWANGPASGWGGDHGNPNDCASDDAQVYLGWTAAEGGKALVVTDLQGNVQWRNNHGGFGGAGLLAVSSGVVYVANGSTQVYKLDAKTGAYLPWIGGGDHPDLDPTALSPDAGKSAELSGLAADKGRIYFAFSKQNTIVVADAATGAYVKSLTVPAPGKVKVGADHLLYALSASREVVVLDPETGTVKTLVTGLVGAQGIALDHSGNLFVDVRDPDNQIKVYSPSGKFLRAIGRPGGRALIGPWTPDGIRYGAGMTIDPEGKLWVAEGDDSPKRISVFDSASGKFWKEFFGSSHYGALGGAIDPLDPSVMVGSGCEWHLDPATGHATCVGIVYQTSPSGPGAAMGNSRFGVGANGRLYLATTPNWAYESARTIYIFERLGPAHYKLRSSLKIDEKAKTTTVWSDANDDGAPQPDEVTTTPVGPHFTGWYMGLASNLTFYGSGLVAPVTGFTACGAPKYDLANATKIPVSAGGNSGVTSPDGKRVVVDNGDDGTVNGTFDCFDVATGKKLWSYPNNYVGVHGSHEAPPSAPGKIYGAYDTTGSASLPPPVGDIWIIPTNVGEWHVLTQDGYYLTRLFQPDPLKVQWPASGIPGSDMTNAASGGGGEDFGGSVTQGSDGAVYVEAGNVAYWNLQMTGLDTIKSLPGAAITITPRDIVSAEQFQDQEAPAAPQEKRLAVKQITPQFTGHLNTDFHGAEIISYQKGDDAAARSAAVWDAQNLYLAWDVHSPGGWRNSAGDPSQMYLGGDTVDFQMGTALHADPNRTEAGLGDLRISIGNVGGHNVAEMFRKVSAVKHPMAFHSGVIANYPMDYAAPITDARINVATRPDGYTVEAAIALVSLGVTPEPGLILPGDFGVTFGDPAGQRTRLRSYWSNRQTGIVDDAVFELMLTPKNWGQLTFEK